MSALCNPTTVPTSLPNIDMTTNWCAIPSNNNQSTSSANNSTTSSSAAISIMQQCCDSAAVHSVGGCEWCYYQDNTAKTSGAFNQDFAACLRREARVRGVVGGGSEGSVVHYCNTPRLKGGAAGRRGVTGWVVAALVGVSVGIQTFA